MKSRDGGFATVMALALGMVLCAVAGVVLVLGQVALARQRAGIAADLAALSAASAFMTGAGEESACASAVRAAQANRAELVACTFESSDAVVEARARVPGVIALVVTAAGSPDGAVHARARAGPNS